MENFVSFPLGSLQVPEENIASIVFLAWEPLKDPRKVRALLLQAHTLALKDHPLAKKLTLQIGKTDQG